MKLEYKVVWFEDSTSFISSNIPNIKSVIEHMKDNGFDISFDIYHNKNLEPGDVMLASITQIHLHKVDDYLPTTLASIKQNIKFADLILVDFHLGGDDQNGNNIINYIRDTPNDIYTDVIFYSAGFDEDGLRGEVKRDGLYCAKKDDVFGGKNKIKKVIDVTIRKTQDLNNLRGLIMAESSEIDKIMKDILSELKSRYNLFPTNGGHYCTSLLACSPCIHCSKITSNFSHHTHGVIFSLRKGSSHAKTISESKSSSLYKAVQLFLSSPLNNTGISSTSLSDYRTYKDNTKRDILAHGPEDTRDTQSVKIIDNDGIEHNFNYENLKEIRKEIRVYKKTFLEIRNLV